MYMTCQTTQQVELFIKPSCSIALGISCPGMTIFSFIFKSHIYDVNTLNSLGSFFPFFLSLWKVHDHGMMYRTSVATPRTTVVLTVSLSHTLLQSSSWLNPGFLPPPLLPAAARIS